MLPTLVKSKEKKHDPEDYYYKRASRALAHPSFPSAHCTAALTSLICQKAVKHANGAILAGRGVGWDETIHTSLLHASFYRGITWLISSMRMGNYGAISVNVALPSSLLGAVTQTHLSQWLKHYGHSRSIFLTFRTQRRQTGSPRPMRCWWTHQGKKSDCILVISKSLLRLLPWLIE